MCVVVCILEFFFCFFEFCWVKIVILFFSFLVYWFKCFLCGGVGIGIVFEWGGGGGGGGVFMWIVLCLIFLLGVGGFFGGVWCVGKGCLCVGG